MLANYKRNRINKQSEIKLQPKKNKQFILLFFAFLALSIITYAQPGAIDPTFNPTDLGFNTGSGANYTIYSTAIQSDGKIIIVGDFLEYNRSTRNHIVRLNTNGTIDASFKPGTGANNSVYSIALQSNGKIIIGGDFTTYNGIARNRIARLNADGTLDTTFNPGLGASSTIYSIALQNDGKITIGGWFTSYNGTAINRIARLNTDGTLDTSFNPGAGANSVIFSIAIQSDGKIIIGGGFSTYNGIARNRIVRLNVDGSLDATFNSGLGNTTVYSVAIQSDSKIIIGGNITSYNGTTINYITRLNADGTFDASFNPGSGANGEVRSIAIQSDGKIIIGGNFTTYNGTTINRIARLKIDGTLDFTFNPGSGANYTVHSIILQSDGNIIIGGSFTSYNGTGRIRISRLYNDGTSDATFNPGSGANGEVRSIAIQSDGKIIIGGDFTTYNGTVRNRIARLNADGTLDVSFNPGLGPNGTVYSIALQSNGKIIIGGQFNSYNGTSECFIARLNADGTADASFNSGLGASYIVYSIVIQSDDKIIIGGQFTSYDRTNRNHIARLNADGTLDTSFNPGSGANDYIFYIALQTDGKIIIAGQFTSYNGTARNHIARLNADGTLDTNFNPGSGANSYIRSIAIQSDGKIIIVGQFYIYDGKVRNYIARLNTDGTLDINFNPGSGASSYVNSMAIQNDGKIIIGGYFTSYNGTARNYIARLNSDGTLDATFNPASGANGYIWSIAIQSDGKIIIGGNFTSYDGTGRNRVARIKSDEYATTINILSNNQTTSSVWPNPTHGNLFVSTNLVGKPYKVYDFTGSLVLTGSSIESIIDLNNLKPSVYLVNIDGIIFKVVKK